MKGNCKKREEIIERMYKELFVKLNIYAVNQLNSKSLAEEAVQETFRIAWIKIDQLMASPNPNGWLMNTLKFVISNTKRNIMRINRLLITEFEMDEGNMGSTNDEIDPMLLYKGNFTKEEIKWGNNIMGYLGLNEKDIYITPQKINFKEKMSKINISPMLCQVVALSDSGNIYTWGFDSMKSSKEQFLEFPVKIEMPEKISEIVVGDVTVYAITDSGNTFTWGGVINNVDKKPQREPVLYSFR